MLPKLREIKHQDAGPRFVEEQDSAGCEKKRDLNARQKAHVQSPEGGADMSLSTGKAGGQETLRVDNEGAVSANK